MGRALARQLLSRHGVVTREAVAAEGVKGGFSAVYDVLKAMEDGGRVRRGYFVAGLGATQFAVPGALDQLRAVRDEQDALVVHLSAVDPANPFGALLRWPSRPEDATVGRGPSRTIGATVILVNGRLGAWLARGDRQLLVYLSDDEHTKTMTARAVAERLYTLATDADGRRNGMLISEVDGCPPDTHPLSPFLLEAGFVRGAMGYQAARARTSINNWLSADAAVAGQIRHVWPVVDAREPVGQSRSQSLRRARTARSR